MQTRNPKETPAPKDRSLFSRLIRQSLLPLREIMLRGTLLRSSLSGGLLCGGLLLTALLSFSACELNPKAPDRYALIYGVARYETAPSSLNLSWTTRDAISLAEKLDDKGYKVYLRLDDGTTTIIDNKGTGDPGDDETIQDYGFDSGDIGVASLAQMEADIRKIKKKANKKSIVLWYYSGHGSSKTDYFGEGALPDKSESSGSNSDDEWLIPYSGDYDALDNYSTWGNIALSDDRLASLLQKLPSKKKVLIIDACLSGGFIGSSYDSDTAPQDYSQSDDQVNDVFGEAFRSYFSDSSADFRWKDGVAITASGEAEYSYEDASYSNGTPSIKHGFFTLGLLKGFSKDKNNDGYISTMELYRSAKNYVERKFNDLYTDPTDYLPRISGGSVDYVLFEAD